MPKYLAFLRAINVGGHTVKMAELSRLFTAQGFTNVETFIASGNVIFDSSATKSATLEKKIAASLQAALGYDVATFLRTPAELTALANNHPFQNTAWRSGGPVLYVGFFATPPSVTARHNVLARSTPQNTLHLTEREVYWRCATTQSQSEFSGALLEKLLGQPVTMRNMTTVNKLVAKYPEV